MVSVISMLADPNDESPANLDAAVRILLFYYVFTASVRDVVFCRKQLSVLLISVALSDLCFVS